MSKEHLKKTDRTNLVRNPSRADYDRDVVNGIIDATSLCHVSYIIDGRPYDPYITMEIRRHHLLAWVVSQSVPPSNSQQGSLYLHHPLRWNSISSFGISPLH